MAAAVRVGVAMGALAGVNGLRVLSKTGAKVGERLLRRGQPAPVGGLDPVDWAYVVGRRANAMRMRTPARPQSLARSIECRSRSPSFPRAGERWRRLTCLSRRAEGGGAGGREGLSIQILAGLDELGALEPHVSFQESRSSHQYISKST